MLLVAVALAVAAVLLAAWSASTTLGARRAIARSLRAVEEYGAPAPSVREQELLATIGERVVAPVGRAALAVARRFTPGGYVANLKRKLVLAGNPPGYEVDRFLVAKVLGAASGAVWFVAIFGLAGLGGPVGVLAWGFAWAVSFLAPDLLLDRRVRARRDAIERALPDLLDLLVISVEAGLGFEQALERTADAVPGPLSEEARRTLHEIRMGAGRADALRALDERTQVDDLRLFVLAMLQADTFGISIARILKSQADEMRLRRRQRAQERAQRAPVKMLFPLVTLVFPAIFVVVLLPALFSIADSLRS